MKLYDFSIYARRRDLLKKEREAALAVAEVINHIEDPDSIPELKLKVNGWFTLHASVLKCAISH